MKEPTRQSQKKIIQIQIPIKPKEQNEFPNEINQLEEWTQLKFKQLIFDSTKDNWNKGTSKFDSIILRKEKLVIFIGTNINDIIIGGFIKRKINFIGKTGDIDCLIFTNKNNQWNKYMIKKSNKYDPFILHMKQDPKFFTFGNDIIIYKEEMKDQSFVNERNSFFEYGKERNVLLGKIGTFSIKECKLFKWNKQQIQLFFPF